MERRHHPFYPRPIYFHREFILEKGYLDCQLDKLKLNLSQGMLKFMNFNENVFEKINNILMVIEFYIYLNTMSENLREIICLNMNWYEVLFQSFIKSKAYEATTVFF